MKILIFASFVIVLLLGVYLIGSTKKDCQTITLKAYTNFSGEYLPIKGA